MNNIKVVLASTSGSVGGMGVVTRLLHQVLLDLPSISVRKVQLYSNNPKELTGLTKMKFGIQNLIPQILNRCDFLLFDHLGGAKIQLLLPSSFRKPYGIFLHGIEVWKELPKQKQQALKKADILLANSKFTLRKVKEHHPYLGKIKVCPLCLPPHTKRIGNLHQQGLNPIGDHSVLIVGRILSSERYKGHDELIEIWSDVKAEVEDAQLIIAGTGDDLPRLKRKVAKTKASDSIFFLGYVDDATLNALYEKTAVFAMPSKGEGFGIVYLEAMHHQTPCIGSIHDAASEVIVDGQTGYLVNQDDPQELKEAIVKLLKDPDLRREMGEAGYEREQTVFTYQNFRDQVGEALQSGGLL